jgi:hypothetical protein
MSACRAFARFLGSCIEVGTAPKWVQHKGRACGGVLLQPAHWIG